MKRDERDVRSSETRKEEIRCQRSEVRRQRKKFRNAESLMVMRSMQVKLMKNPEFRIQEAKHTKTVLFFWLVTTGYFDFTI